MAMMFSRVERRDGADRNELATAVFAWCRASRARDDVTSSRFYWSSPDTIVMLTEAESWDVFNGPGTPESAAAMFHVSDLARVSPPERWIAPAEGEAAYRAAGR